jgi:hypothetical protein
VLVSIVAGGCTAQETSIPAGWKQFESAELGVKAVFPCQPEKTSSVDDPVLTSVSCQNDGLRFVISRTKHTSPYDYKPSQDIFADTRILLKGLVAKPEQFSESEDCRKSFPCRVYDLVTGNIRMRSLIVVKKDATVEAMVSIVTSGSAVPSQESLSAFDSTSTSFIEGLEVLK